MGLEVVVVFCIMFSEFQCSILCIHSLKLPLNYNEEKTMFFCLWLGILYVRVCIQLGILQRPENHMNILEAEKRHFKFTNSVMIIINIKTPLL